MFSRENIQTMPVSKKHGKNTPDYRRKHAETAREKYWKEVRDINKVGIKRLRAYSTTKKCPVRNFDRDISILKCYLTHGAAYTAKRFHIWSSQPCEILMRYHKYALTCLEADERSKTEIVFKVM